VSDSGIGIAQQDVPRLFSEFSQVDPSNTRRFGGTGLGLAISDRLVRLMGGAIGYTPAVGGGSTFWFTVPFEVPEKSGHLKSALDAIDTSSASVVGTKPDVSPTVLIVEDNEINAVILARMLTLLGYRSDIARSGADALEAVTRSGYTTILMDCQMPGMDGFTTTEKLRAEPSAGPRIPVIAITATATTEDQARCLAAGMDDYLPKPIVMERLAAVLERWAPILSA
jgi:CheY-like chemotaxis protein